MYPGFLASLPILGRSLPIALCAVCGMAPPGFPTAGAASNSPTEPFHWVRRGDPVLTAFPAGTLIDPAAEWTVSPR